MSRGEAQTFHMIIGIYKQAETVKDLQDRISFLKKEELAYTNEETALGILMKQLKADLAEFTPDAQEGMKEVISKKIPGFVWE